MPIHKLGTNNQALIRSAIMNKLTKIPLPKQRGAVLLMSLIILLVMTMLGVASIDSTGLEMKMSSNNRNQQLSFQRAEAGLIEAERFINQTAFTDEEISNIGCSTDNCFVTTACADVVVNPATGPAVNFTRCTADCNNGNCAMTTYTDALDRTTCSVNQGAVPVWEDDALDVWNDANKHRRVAINGVAVNFQPRYIIESLCYIADDPGAVMNNGNSVPFFRVTVLATDDLNLNPVMLQTTYRAN